MILNCGARTRGAPRQMHRIFFLLTFFLVLGFDVQRTPGGLRGGDPFVHGVGNTGEAVTSR